MTDRRWYPAMWVCALLCSAALLAGSLFLGDVNQDEGWYLYAARLVSQGKLPYIDFASTQGPVMPFVYALAGPLVRYWGLAGGRLFTAALGLCAALCAAGLAARIVPRGRRAAAALMAFALAGVNVYQSYFCTIVKTYALAGLFLVLGFMALHAACERRSAGRAALSGVLLALALGTRVSAGLVLPVAALLPLWHVAQPPQAGRGGAVRVFLWFAAGAAVTALALFVPFLIKAPEALRFALVEYHSGREVGGVVSTLAYKAGFVSRLVNAYAVAALLSVSAGLYRILVRRRGSVAAAARADAPQTAGAERRFLAVLWLSVAGVTAGHLLAPFPYDDYQVMVFPAVAAALAATLARLPEEETVAAEDAAAAGRGGTAARRVQLWLAAAVLLANAAVAFSSPILQGWFTGKRDRIWWPLKKESPLALLQRTAALVRDAASAPNGGMLLTQDLYLAVEAGLDVPPGLELGPFSYFPEWSREKAVKCHVLNREMMLETLETCGAPFAAFSGYGLAIRAPQVSPLSQGEQTELWAAVLRHYEPFRDIENFGQAETTLRVLRLRH